MAERREGWSSRIGVILAVAGSAVGLGNFLRFPGRAVENGGGAFMIPYFCALLFLGIPIGWAEWTMGRYGGRRGFRSTPAILAVTGGPRARYFGVLGVLVPLVVYMYYVLIESWCLRYAWSYLTGQVNLGLVDAQVGASKELFTRVTGSARDGFSLGGAIDPALGFWALVMLFNLWLVHKGLSGGIERFCRWAMPLMAVCALIVLARVVTLGTPNPALPEQNVVNGLGFMWNPNFAALRSFDTWLAAAGQIFFSLSVGFGVIINYASYLKKDDDVVLSSLTASSVNELFEVVFGGLITVTASFVFLGAQGASGGTFGLGFNTLPVVFAQMGSFGRLIGAVWFFMLFLAAITSSLSMLQPVCAFLQESLDIPRGKAVAAITVLSGSGSLWVLYFSKDLAALEAMDFWVGTVCIFILATVQTIVFGWVWGVDQGIAEAQRGAQIAIPRAFRFVIKYVSPTFLLIVLIGFCVQNLPDHLSTLASSPVAKGTAAFVLVVYFLLLAVAWRGARRQAALAPAMGTS